MDVTLPTWMPLAGLIAGVIGTGGIGMLLKAWLDHRLGMRKQTDDISISMVAATNSRLDTVERAAAEERRLSAHERALCAAELRHAHHCIGNQAGTISSMFMMLEVASPERLKDIVRMAREKVAQDKEIEAIERAAIVHLRAALGVPPDEAPLPADAAAEAMTIDDAAQAA